MSDKYRNFEQLRAREVAGRDYRIRRRDRGSKLLIMSPHAGAIEPGISEVVMAVAGEDLSFYLFEGIKPAGNGTLHITSTNFDEPHGLEITETSDKVIAFHGEGSSAEIVYIGGGDVDIRPHVERCLQEAGFVTGTHGNLRLHGTSPGNICNRCHSGSGLQLELSRGLRERFFRSPGADGRHRRTALLDRFARAMRTGLSAAHEL